MFMKKSMILLFMLFKFFFYLVLDIIVAIIVLPIVFFVYKIWLKRYSLDLYVKAKRYIKLSTLLITSVIVALLAYKVIIILYDMFLLGFISEIICHLLGYKNTFIEFSDDADSSMMEVPDDAPNDISNHVWSNAIYLICVYYHILPCDFFLVALTTYYPMLLLNKIIPRRSDQY